jgi:hypothetical protein
VSSAAGARRRVEREPVERGAKRLVVREGARFDGACWLAHSIVIRERFLPDLFREERVEAVG